MSTGNEPSEKSPDELTLRFRRLRQQSRLVRFLMSVGIVSLGVVFFGCISCALIQNLFGPKKTKVAGEIDQITASILPITVPAGYEPSVGVAADNSLMLLELCRYQQKQGRGLLLIGQFNLRQGPWPGDEASLRRFLEAEESSLRLITPQKKSVRSFVVREKRATFEIVEGEDRASTTKLRQVTGTFPGREGVGMLILQAEQGFLSDADIETLLQALTTGSPEQTHPKSDDHSHPASAVSPANGLAPQTPDK